MSVSVKEAFLSLCLMAVLLCWWLFNYLWCLLLWRQLPEDLQQFGVYFLHVFHRIICFLFQQNINILMQFTPLINGRGKSAHFSHLHSFYSISYSCTYLRIFELITHIYFLIPVWKIKHFYLISLTFSYYLLQEKAVLGEKNFAIIKYIWQSDILSLCSCCDPSWGNWILPATSKRSAIAEFKGWRCLCESWGSAQNTTIHFRDQNSHSLTSSFLKSI